MGLISLSQPSPILLLFDNSAYTKYILSPWFFHDEESIRHHKVYSQQGVGIFEKNKIKKRA